jgi:hypothetical protein
LAVQKGGPVGLVAVIVFDADPWPLLRATRNQRIVDDQQVFFAFFENIYRADGYLRYLEKPVNV